jgi:hypothetical protein
MEGHRSDGETGSEPELEDRDNRKYEERIAAGV